MLKQFLALSLAIVVAPLWAQNDEQAVRQVINEVIKGLSEVQTTKDASKILQNFSKGIVFTSIEIGIHGKAKTSVLDYAGLAKLFSEVSNDEGQILKINGFNITKVAVQDATGVASFVYDYELSVGGNTISKGSESGIYMLEKTSEGWKINVVYQVSIESLQLKGTCRCELYKGGTGYATKTLVPAGSEYVTNLDNFTFKNTPTGKIITAGNKTYSWQNGIIAQLKNDGTVAKELGKAVGDEEAVRMILEKSIYEANCSQIIIKK